MQTIITINPVTNREEVRHVRVQYNERDGLCELKIILGQSYEIVTNLPGTPEGLEQIINELNRFMNERW